MPNVHARSERPNSALLSRVHHWRRCGAPMFMCLSQSHWQPHRRAHSQISRGFGLPSGDPTNALPGVHVPALRRSGRRTVLLVAVGGREAGVVDRMHDGPGAQARDRGIHRIAVRHDQHVALCLVSDVLHTGLATSGCQCLQPTKETNELVRCVDQFGRAVRRLQDKTKQACFTECRPAPPLPLPT